MEGGETRTELPPAARMPFGFTGAAQADPVPGAETPPVPDEVVFLEPGQAGAQNIVRAISHQNAGDVLSMLAEAGPLRLSDIAGRQGISINAAKYHVDQLMNAGLLEIANTRYSVKGRKVKIYRLKNQIFVIAPKIKQKDFLTAILKSCSALGLFALVFLVAFFQPFVTLPSVSLRLAGSMAPMNGVPAAPVTDHGVIPALIIGGIVTLLVLFLYQVYASWKENRSIFGS
ncbi:MAG TPA: winged helix-turn-helix domain-containing protein [Methanoregula sp.]|nr:winged helix-turn-helix domain-containing protein [Methanoregula sp.]